jgi:Peptidase inhibitor I9
VNLSPQAYAMVAIILATVMISTAAALSLQSTLSQESANAQKDKSSPTSNETSSNQNLSGMNGSESYIVTLKNQSSSADLDDIIKSVEQKGADVTHVYTHSLNGFSIQIPSDKKTEIMYSLVTDTRVNSVEPDQIMTLSPPLE